MSDLLRIKYWLMLLRQQNIIIIFILMIFACFPNDMLWLDFSPFHVVVFIVSLPVWYRYLGRGDLVAGRLEGCDGNSLP